MVAQKTSKFIQQAGFTLTELIIVVAIIGFVMAVTVPSITSYSRRQELNVEAENLVARIELAQSRARTGYQGEGETQEVQGYLIDFTNIATEQKYYLRRHLNVGSAPYTIVEDQYVLDDSIASVSFESPSGTPSLIRVFYYQSPQAFLACLTTLPANGSEPSQCGSSQFRITLQNTHGEVHYVYIERGGVIYESEP